MFVTTIVTVTTLLHYVHYAGLMLKTVPIFNSKSMGQRKIMLVYLWTSIFVAVALRLIQIISIMLVQHQKKVLLLRFSMGRKCQIFHKASSYQVLQYRI